MCQKQKEEKRKPYRGNINDIKNIMGNIKVNENLRLSFTLIKMNGIF